MVSTTIFLNSGVYRLFPIPLVIKSPHLLFSISYCLTNGVQFSSNKKAVFAVFALFGVGHPRWGDFEKPALKSPETRMNTEKNRGDIYFVTPSCVAVSKLLSACLMPFGRNL